MNKPFDVWFKQRHPEKCQVCFGEGQFVIRGNFVDRMIFKCEFCAGTGLSDKPLFVDEPKEVK